MEPDLLKEAAERANRYLQSLAERRAFPATAAIENLKELALPWPEESQPPHETLRLLDEIGSPAATASAGGRYFGFVTGGTLPAALAAHCLATAWDQNAFSRASSPLACSLEDTALAWLRQALSLPATCAGALVTGATLANFTGLAAARHFLLQQAGWDLAENGLYGAPQINIVVGAEAHPTLLKSLRLLGFGRRQVQTVPVDGQGRMRAEALPPLPGPTILCLQAGNVNTGAFDPADALVPRAREAGAWVHVDGAFGLWAAASPQHAHLCAGFDAADSWATDAHKWLNTPYDCGLAFTRHANALQAAMSIEAAYLPQSPAREPFHHTPEASRRARGVDVWAALHSLGRRGLAELIERNCSQARRLAEGLAAAGHEILNTVELNQVLVSFGEATERIIEAVQAEGTCWCGGTVWQGRRAMRLSVSSWATTDEDIERSLAAIIEAARQTS